MKRSTGLPWLWVGSILTAWLATAVSAQEADPTRIFLDALRQRGYYDTALDYLDQVRDSRRCPEDLKETIDYEAGITLVSGLRQAGKAQARRQLDQAAQRFENFIREHPQHPLCQAANSRRAHALLERGRISAESASQPARSDEEKSKLRAEARQLYLEARQGLKEAEKGAYEEAKTFERPLDPTIDAATILVRDRARNAFLNVKLRLAETAYEIGVTYEQGTGPFEEGLNEAAALFHALFEKYPTRAAGLYARMWEGRIARELGKPEEAVNTLKELLKLPDAPEALHLLKMQSLALLVETYLSTDPKQYEEAIATVGRWQKNALGGDESRPEGLKIRYLGGLAAQGLAESLEANDPRRRANLAAAREHFDFVARAPGEFQAEAGAGVLALAGVSKTQEPPPANYAQAKERGDFSLANMEIARGQVRLAGSRELQDKAALQMNDARDQAIAHYRTALAMADSDVSTPDLNRIRFRLAYLYWLSGQWYRAAVLGEFLARCDPEGEGAQKGAEIAVKAYRNLFIQARKLNEDESFEVRRMNRVAKYATQRWPGQPEAEEAWMMLVDTAVDRGDVPGALAYLDEIAAESPRRGQAELRTGQALWAAYLNAARKDADQRPPQAELDLMADQARQTLEQGIERTRPAVDDGGEASYLLVYSVLSVAQICLGAGQSEQAVTWLDDPAIGPVTLVKAEAPAIQGKGPFIEDVYKTALRAYVAAQELEKATSVMTALEQIIAQGGDAGADRRLTEIFIRLGSQMQQQLTQLGKENKTDEIERVSRGFELFLNRIAGRQQASDYASLNWMALTFAGLAAGLDPGGKAPPLKAREYYAQASNTYLQILRKARRDPDFVISDDALLSVKRRMAGVLTAQGEHEKAMSLLVPILVERQTRLAVQIEAAQTYQHWGMVRAGYYQLAISGGEKSEGRNLVWGWAEIARRVFPFMGREADGQKYAQAYHGARYNLAYCRFELARSQTGQQRIKTFRMAESDVTRLHQLYPKMGGAEWFDKYDRLLKNIQKAQGEKAVGLQRRSGSTKRRPPRSAPQRALALR